MAEELRSEQVKAIQACDDLKETIKAGSIDNDYSEVLETLRRLKRNVSRRIIQGDGSTEPVVGPPNPTAPIIDPMHPRFPVDPTRDGCSGINPFYPPTMPQPYGSRPRPRMLGPGDPDLRSPAFD